jgi:hypothetical protein
VAADIVGHVVYLTVTGPISTIGTSSETLEINADILNTSTAGGNIFLNDTAGGVALGLVTAGSGDVNLGATNGSITDAGVEGGGVIGSTVNLSVTGVNSSIGSSQGDLNVEANTLDVVTGGGRIFITGNFENYDSDVVVDTAIVPNLVFQNNHLVGGSDINRVYQAQTVLNTQQLVHERISTEQSSDEDVLFAGEGNVYSLSGDTKTLLY